MEQRRLRLGDILDDYCPRERRLTNHAVVAMIEEDVKQTRCTTCDTEHAYKGGKIPKRRKKDNRRPSTRKFSPDRILAKLRTSSSITIPTRRTLRRRRQSTRSGPCRTSPHSFRPSQPPRTPSSHPSLRRRAASRSTRPRRSRKVPCTDGLFGHSFRASKARKRSAGFRSLRFVSAATAVSVAAIPG
jgi:hypothetical protein